MNASTLVSEVAIMRPDGVTRQKDVPVTIEDRGGWHGKTVITIGWANGERVAITLTDAERYALKEALHR